MMFRALAGRQWHPRGSCRQNVLLGNASDDGHGVTRILIQAGIG